MWKASTSRLSSALTRREGRRAISHSRQNKAKQPDASTKVALNCPPPPPKCPPPPPIPPPPRKGRSLFGTAFKLLTVSTVGAGGVAGYAWYDPVFRDTLEDNVPYSKEAMSALFIYLGAETMKESQQTPAVTDDQPLSLKGFEKESIEENKSKEDVKLDAQRSKEELKRRAEDKVKQREKEEVAANAAMEVILENLMKRSEEIVQKAVTEQKILAETTKKHTDLLKRAMEDTSQILDKDRQWNAVADAFKSRENASKAAHKAVQDAKSLLGQLKNSIDVGKENKSTKKNKTLTTAQESFNKANHEMRTICAQVMRSESDARVMTTYKSLIDQGRQQFAEELDSIMPDVKLGNRSKKLTEEELNALIAHAHRRVEQLQKQLAEQMAMESQRVEKALQQQVMEDERVGDERVSAALDALKANTLLEKDQWDAEARVDFEKELRQQLARQAAAHSDHLQDVLQVQSHELERQCEREVHTQLLKERQSFQSEVAGWIARLKGIETAVEARAESEKIARVAQDLWLACIALNGLIRHGNEEANLLEAKLQPLKKEVETISDAGGKHPFVETLIQSIPEAALERGVWTEDSLRERFPQVQRVCRRVAMMDDSGGTLFKYFISYVQSFFVFDSVFAKSEHDAVDPDKLDTFSILGHAEFWMERGDLEQAVRFMNQLQGAARLVAGDWVNEAKLLLETRQAAFALTAFASASGLGTIF